MKKFLTVLLLVAMCTALMGTTYAAENSPSDQETTVVDIWLTLRETGDLYVDSNGFLSVKDNSLVNEKAYEKFLHQLSICNESIASGILVVDSKTAIVMCPEDYSTQMSIRNETQEAENANEEGYVVPLNVAHGCTIQALDMLTVCRRNYNELKNYHAEMISLEKSNPGFDGFTATIGFWIMKVKSGGNWDYKSSSIYGPWNNPFCSYFDGQFNHITAEYFGNFNYGYTGSYLFDLNTLHDGSYAASGFNPTDKEDWPAIDAGFRNAP